MYKTLVVFGEGRQITNFNVRNVLAKSLFHQIQKKLSGHIGHSVLSVCLIRLTVHIQSF